MRRFLPLALVAGCALHADSRPELIAAISGPPADRCLIGPDFRQGQFRHSSNRLLASLGDPRHRGTDLIAVETDAVQTLGGKLAYTSADADIAGEPVSVFACIDQSWKLLGVDTTDKHGRFSLTLHDAERLPVGMRDLYALAGDGVGFRFVAYVAKAGESVIVTDLDGTVTAGEGAVLNSVLFDEDIGHRVGAPQALARSGHTVIYVSSRGDQLTGLTRTWLRTHGFPPGPLRLAEASVTKPGPKTIAFKTAALRGLGLPIHAAIGNRASDVVAYGNAGVPAQRIFVKLPGFEDELAGLLGAHRAVGFHSYDFIAPRLR